MISPPTVNCVIHTGASNLGWEAHDQDQNINGRCSDSEKTLHMNCLELLAINFGQVRFWCGI